MSERTYELPRLAINATSGVINYTQNLQRPYTAFAPCPLPPAQNTVTVAIEAGEQQPVFNR